MRRKYLAIALLLGCISAMVVFLSVARYTVLNKMGASPAKSVVPPHRAGMGFYQLVLSIFAQLDREQKGFITQQDIERAILTDHSIAGEQAAALYVLHQNFPSLVDGTNGNQSISQAGLQRFHDAAPEPITKSVNNDMQQALNFLKKVNRGLYPAGDEATSLHNMRTIHQVHRTNCYFESGCGSLAAIDAKSLRRMIVDNGVDARSIRTYSVRFLRAPEEEYIVEELTDAGLLVNDVDIDSGTWMSILVRAYGMYQLQHPLVRFWQRQLYGLDDSILPEDITNQGSMFNDGLYMCSPPDTSIQQVAWFIDKTVVRAKVSEIMVLLLQEAIDKLSSEEARKLEENFGLPVQDLTDVLKGIDRAYIKGPLAEKITDFLVDQLLAKLIIEPRDPAKTHAQLKETICDLHQPATVTKYGGEHEASIIDYRPGTQSWDGKHTSKFGFVTIRDQSGLSWEEEFKIDTGLWWREAGMDDQTVCMSVEEFTAYYPGFARVVKP